MDLVEERVPRRALVRLGIADRHPPLVAEEHVDGAPVDVGDGEQLIAPARSRPARQRQRPRRLPDNQLCERLGHVRNHPNVAMDAHGVLHVSP